MTNNQLKMKITYLQILIKKFDIPSTIDFQSESFNQYSPFPYQQNKQKTNNPNPEDQFDIHDYDNYNNPRRHTYVRYNFRPQPRKDYRIFLGVIDSILLSQAYPCEMSGVQHR